jgi:superfamily II DNA or RNA helicase
MRLDLKNNELVFSYIEKNKLALFLAALENGKGLKYRNYKGTIYIPLRHFDVARQVLKEFKNELTFTLRYEKFASLFVLNKDVIKIKWYPCECIITGRVPFDLIIPNTSYFNKAALQSKAYEKGQWDGLTHMFDTMTGKFPSGLLERIVTGLNERGMQYDIERMFNYPAPELTLRPKFEFTPSDDQIKAVDALDRSNNGIAKCPTGFGKTSYVAAKLISQKGVKSLFLANQRVLINDAKDDFKKVFADCDIKIGTIGDGEFDPGDITVASIQGVIAALTPPSQLEKDKIAKELMFAEQQDDQRTVKRLKTRMKKLLEREEKSRLIKPFLEEVELFVVDEGQALGTDMWNKFLKACPAPYRYTLSATPIRTDGGALAIIGATGERRFESSADEQIQKGRLSEFRSYFRKFDHKVSKDVQKTLTMDYHQAYELFIVNNKPRNEYLCSLVVDLAKQGFSVLALVTRKAHAAIIQQTLLEMGMPEGTFAYVDGDTGKKKRKTAIEDFRASKFPILIGTSIFDVGFNAKNASKIVRFNGGGSEVREPQRAGRTVRMRDDGSIGESFDLLDINVPFFETQSYKRIKILKEEFGNHRVEVMRDLPIEGELDIVALQEFATKVSETDEQRGKEILEQLTFINTEFEAPDEFSELKDAFADRDLQGMLAQLEFKG